MGDFSVLIQKWPVPLSKNAKSLVRVLASPSFRQIAHVAVVEPFKIEARVKECTLIVGRMGDL